MTDDDKIKRVIDKLDKPGYCYYSEEFPSIGFGSLSMLEDFKRRVASSPICSKKDSTFFKVIPKDSAIL